MGGGGLVGIAWELGVLAGLQEAVGLDPTSAAVVVGSSAGSVSGAQAALGRDLKALVESQLRTARSGGSTQSAGTTTDDEREGAPTQPQSISQEMLDLMMSSTG